MTTARANAKWPGGRWRPGGWVPVAGLLQRIGHVLGHVGLVVLRQHLGGTKRAVGPHRAQCHHALAFAEQVRKDADIGHLNAGTPIRYAELRGGMAIVGGTLDAALLDQAAETKCAAGWRGLAREVRGREEEHQVVAEGEQRQRGGGAKAQPAGQQYPQTAALAGHSAPAPAN